MQVGELMPLTMVDTCPVSILFHDHIFDAFAASAIVTRSSRAADGIAHRSLQHEFGWDDHDRAARGSTTASAVQMRRAHPTSWQAELGTS